MAAAPLLGISADSGGQRGGGCLSRAVGRAVTALEWDVLLDRWRLHLARMCCSSRQQWWGFSRAAAVMLMGELRVGR